MQPKGVENVCYLKKKKRDNRPRSALGICTEYPLPSTGT